MSNISKSKIFLGNEIKTNKKSTVKKISTKKTTAKKSTHKNKTQKLMAPEEKKPEQKVKSDVEIFKETYPTSYLCNNESELQKLIDLDNGGFIHDPMIVPLQTRKTRMNGGYKRDVIMDFIASGLNDQSYAFNLRNKYMTFDFKLSDKHLMINLPNNYILVFDECTVEVRLVKLDYKWECAGKTTMKFYKTVVVFRSIVEFYVNLPWIVLFKDLMKYRCYKFENCMNRVVIQISNEYLRYIANGNAIKIHTDRSGPEEFEVLLDPNAGFIPCPNWFPQLSFFEAYSLEGNTHC